jgi:hypothetical protein
MFSKNYPGRDIVAHFMNAEFHINEATLHEFIFCTINVAACPFHICSTSSFAPTNQYTRPILLPSHRFCLSSISQAPTPQLALRFKPSSVQ